MVDATSGVALVDKTPKLARNSIVNMAANSLQFNMRFDSILRRVNEINVSNVTEN